MVNTVKTKLSQLIGCISPETHASRERTISNDKMAKSVIDSGSDKNLLYEVDYFFTETYARGRVIASNLV